MRKHPGLLALQALTADYPAAIELPKAKTPRKKSANKKPLEKEIQRTIIGLLNRHPKVAWVQRMNTGAFKVGANQFDKGRYFKAGFQGCSDIIGQLKNGKFLAVEVKRPGGKLSEQQRAFIETVEKNGGVGFVAYSVEDVIKRLEALK